MRVLFAASSPFPSRLCEAFASIDATLDEAETVDDLIELCRLTAPDIVLLGRSLADVDPLTALRQLRRAGVGTPTVWLCGDAPSLERATALDLGADDCVGSDADAAEVLARTRAVLRRLAGHATSAVAVGPLTIDLVARKVEVAGRRLKVTRKEFALLELLALRRGAVVRRETIMDHLYAGPDEPVAKVLDIHVCRIRRKLAEAAPGETLLRTVWGQGFVLDGREAATPPRLVA